MMAWTAQPWPLHDHTNGSCTIFHHDKTMWWRNHNSIGSHASKNTTKPIHAKKIHRFANIFALKFNNSLFILPIKIFIVIDNLTTVLHGDFLSKKQQ